MLSVIFSGKPVSEPTMTTLVVCMFSLTNGASFITVMLIVTVMPFALFADDLSSMRTDSVAVRLRSRESAAILKPV